MGGTFTTTASKAAGQVETFELRGNWGPGQHRIDVSFVNDAWGGSASTGDRNFYVASAAMGGREIANGTVILYSNGTGSLTGEIPQAAAQPTPVTVTGTAGDDVRDIALPADGSPVRVDLGGGTDTLRYSTAQGFTGQVAMTLSGVETVTGGGGGSVTITLENRVNSDVTMNGTADRVILGGRDGDLANTVTVHGVETVTGSDVRDIVRVDAFDGVVTLDLGAGADRIELIGTGRHAIVATGVEAILGNAGADAVELRGAQGTGPMSIDLGEGSDSIVGYDAFARDLLVSSAESIVLGGGNDTVTLRTAAKGMTIDLGGGMDILTLGDLGNTIRTVGVEDIRGGKGADGITVTGSTAAIVWGGAGADVIVGGAGNDVIVGGLGKDVMTGGAGADRFFFAAVQDSDSDARDIVTDFQPGQDQLDFRGIAHSGFRLIGEAEFSRGGGTEARFLDATDQLLIDLDGNGSIDMRMTLQGVEGSRLVTSDFLWS